MSMHKQAELENPHLDRQRQAESRVKGAGYKVGGQVDEGDKKAVHRHERHLHKGEKETKLADGGVVAGAPSKPAAHRRARGGSMPHKGKGHLNIVIQNSNPAEKQEAAKQGMKIGAQLGAKQAAAHMAGAGAGGPPPGAGGPPPGLPTAPPGGIPPGPPGIPPRPMAPPMRSRGGKMPDAEGGDGPKINPDREHQRIHVREHERRRAGGRCE